MPDDVLSVASSHHHNLAVVGHGIPIAKQPYGGRANGVPGEIDVMSNGGASYTSSVMTAGSRREKKMRAAPAAVVFRERSLFATIVLDRVDHMESSVVYWYKVCLDYF